MMKNIEHINRNLLNLISVQLRSAVVKRGVSLNHNQTRNDSIGQCSQGVWQYEGLFVRCTTSDMYGRMVQDDSDGLRKNMESMTLLKKSEGCAHYLDGTCFLAT